MIALGIIDIRRFMSAFLVGTHFDDYALAEARITTFCTFSIDGRLEPSFFGEDSRTGASSEDSGHMPDPAVLAPVSYIRWGQVRERCFDIIKGKRTPLGFKFVFFYPAGKMDAFYDKYGITGSARNLSGLCLNLKFDGSRLILTTGTSMKTFSTDRAADHAWDDEIREILASLSILTEDFIS